MKVHLVFVALIGFLLGGCGPYGTERRPPNILFILIDDMGYTGPSVYGNQHVDTPHIDNLARDGMRFTAAYVQPQCSPTRATLLTGQHTARTNMWHVVANYGYPWARLAEPDYVRNLPRSLPLVSERLRAAGYRTAIFGKWHLSLNEDTARGGLNPEASEHYGFDVADSISPSETDDKSVRYLTDRTIEFLSASRDRPFFCFLSHFTVHTRVAAPQEIIDDYLARGYPPAGPDQHEGRYNATYLAMIKHLDNETGRVLQKLEELGLRGETVVVFLSDNGGVLRCFDNGPLRSGKGTLYEGGVRVPLIVRWPGVVEPGTVSDYPVHAVDFYPTLVEMAGGELPAAGEHPLDGASFVPTLRGEQQEPRTIYWHAPLYDVRWGATPGGAIRDGDYKLIEFFGDYIDTENDNAYEIGPRLELYNLREDIGEQTNLAGTMPEKTAELQSRLEAWRKRLDARMPVLNPNYDPKRALQQARVEPD